jgi:hypothetical protein
MLMVNSDKLPEKYQPLVKSLQKIYIEDRKDLEETLKISEDVYYPQYLGQ